jgi:hypothetical protein
MAASDDLIEKLYPPNPNETPGMDPTKYADPAKIPMLTRPGATMASITGGRGTVVPRNNGHGASLGYRADLFGPAIIDPDKTGGQLVADQSGFTKDELNEVYREVSGETNRARRFALYHHRLETLRRQRRAAAPIDLEKVAATAREAQVQANTLVTPSRQIGDAASTPTSIIADVERHHGSLVPALPRTVEPPQRKVAFELPTGLMTCFYHDIRRTDELLILVYDHNYPTQHIWFPEVVLPKQRAPDDEDQLLDLDVPDPREDMPRYGAMVYDLDGHPDTAFILHPTQARFRYDNHEFCLLQIVDEKPYKQPVPPQRS